jgi:hypothetical protein
MGLLFLPLHGALLVLGAALLVIKLFALVDALTHPESAYQAAGKLTKTAWVVILVVALLFTLIGLVAALVYLVDVRPALRSLKGGSRSSGGW